MKKQLLLTAIAFISFFALSYSQCNAPSPFLSAFTSTSVSFGCQFTSSTSVEYSFQAEDAAAPDSNPQTVYPVAMFPITFDSLDGQPLLPSQRCRFYVRTRCGTQRSQWVYMNYIVPPVNDLCANAIPLAVNPTQEITLKTQANTGGATSSNPTPPNCAYNDIWFSFVATATAHAINITDTNEATLNIRQSLFSGTCGLLTQRYCTTGNSGVARFLTIGDTYYVRIGTTSGNPFNISVTSPPLNDECANALTVAVNPYGSTAAFATGSTLAATSSEPTASIGAGCNTTEDDVWFAFTATSTSQVIKLVNLVTGAALNHSLYTANCGTLLYCSDPDISFAKNLQIGNEYKIRVYTSNSAANIFSNFQLFVSEAPVITNDECADATTLTVVPFSTNPTLVHGSLTSATASPQSAGCSGSDDDVWYKFTANSATQIVEFRNVTGIAALNHAVYGGDCENLTQVYCKVSSNTAEATNLIIGNTYYLRVFSAGSTPQEVDFDVLILKPAVPISISNQFSATQLVNTVLLDNPCITTSNITFETGLSQNIQGLGYFSAANSDFPLDSGILLSTGSIGSAAGPNTSTLGIGTDAWLGDADLDAIILAATGTGMESKNATKLEFDFTTANANMSFNFLFASEEYGQFQCDFSDAFAFLLTDLTTGITTNLAVVPNTTSPISTVTIRDGIHNTSCNSVNEDFFDAFYGTVVNGAAGLSNYLSPTNFNGHTKVMTASSVLIPNNPYHIKLVVADRLDSNYDSAVFIQAGSFTSGPPECSDKIKLISFVDTNGNGTKDDGESSFTYGSFVYQVNDAPEINNISSPIGNYTIYDSNPANSYDFSFAIDAEYQSYFATPSINLDNVTIPVGSGTNTLYFPITLTQAYNDVTVSIVPVSPPVAGMSFKNKIVYTNHGVAPASGSIQFTKDALTSVAFISEIVTSIPGGFVYNFINLAPFETRSIDLVLTVPPIPTVNIDDLLTNSVAISASANDINGNNNTFSNSQIVVASYDPNDKMEAHGGKIKFTSFNQNDYLTYTIRFQNTGTSNAINIRIEDLLDAQFDEASIRMIGASHNYIMKRVGNKLTWYFDYIQLPGMIVNEPQSHGYLTFMIKLKPGFSIGDIVPNNADIYFDTNPAITTNTFNVEFVMPLSAPEFDQSTVMVYPNPTKSILNINSTEAGCVIEKVTVYDLVGKVVKSININSVETALNVSDIANGIYLIEITDDTNRKFIHKMIKN